MSTLLFHVTVATDRQRVAVGATLAAAAERAGWLFDCYHDTRRLGLHFGGSDVTAAAAAGSTMAGGRHVEQLLWLAATHRIVAVGDPGSPLWPTLEAVAADCIAATDGPAALLRATFEYLGEALPGRLVVLDDQPQGRHGVRTAPYAVPGLLAGPPASALEASAGRDEIASLAATADEVLASWVAPDRRAGLGDLLTGTDGEVADRAAADVTATMAARHRDWGRGILLADPDLVAAQLPKLARLRLLPLHGEPQVEVVRRARDIVAAAAEPVYGRQHDDRDFIILARAGHGLQVVDPSPPFDSATSLPPVIRRPALERATGPLRPERAVVGESDEELRRWAEEGRVLTTLLFWVGMIRELDCVPPLLDLLATTGIRAGAVVTVDTVRHGLRPPFSLVAEDVDRGGASPQLELLLGSTGWGVAAEAYLEPELLHAHLDAAMTAMRDEVPPDLVPRGWWPLLDSRLVPARARRVGWQRGPVVYFTPRELEDPGEELAPGEPTATTFGGSDRPRLAGRVVEALHLRRFVAARRPYDAHRPGDLRPRVVQAVAEAGFDYMWTKTGFGIPRATVGHGGITVVPSTAGNWDGWSPFYTVGSVDDVERAERRLLRSGEPGWLVSTVDSPLWLMPGEVMRHGARLHDLADVIARGGTTGRLHNVTPHVVARYARLLAERR